MADETVDIDVNIKTNAEGSIAQLKELKKQLKALPAGSEEFKKLYNAIDDLEDKLKGAKNTSKDFFDTLEGAGGPIGLVGKGLNSLKVATTSFGAAFKAAGIGLLISIVGGIAGAFSQVEGSGKKLEPLLIGFQKILGGILAVIQPLLDAFINLALKALPFVTTGIGKLYSAFVAFFTLIKEAGIGVGKILKGLFTLNFKTISEGYEQIKGSWSKTVTAYEQGVKDYTAGTKNVTKAEKDALEANKKIYDEKKKLLEDTNKLQDASLEKAKAVAEAGAITEQQKLDVQISFAAQAYNQSILQNDALLKLAKKFGQDTKEIQAARLKLEGDFTLKKAGFADQQKAIDEKLYQEQLKVIAGRKTLDLFENDRIAANAKFELDQIKANGELILGAKKDILGNQKDFQNYSFISEQGYAERLRQIQEDRDSRISEISKKNYEDLIAAADEYYTSRLNAVKGNADATFVIEKEYKDALIAINKTAAEEEAKLVDNQFQRNVDIAAAIKVLNDQTLADTLRVEQLKQEAYKATADALASSLSSISTLFASGTKEQKAFAIASVLVTSALSIFETFARTKAALADFAKAKARAAASIAEGIAIAPLNPVLGAALIAAGTAAGAAATAGGITATVSGIAQGVAIAAQAAAQIAAINGASGSGGGSSAAAGGGSSSTPTFSVATVGAPQIGPTSAQQGIIAGVVAGAISANQSGGSPIKAYVVGNDITTQQQLERRLRAAARLGG